MRILRLFGAVGFTILRKPKLWGFAMGTTSVWRFSSCLRCLGVFVSPFIRCVQAASEVVNALSAVDLEPNATSSKDVLSIDKSKLKVSIEFCFSEMLNTISIKPKIAPRDRKFEFLISDLEAMFPEGMVDHDAIPAYKEMPQWGETVQECTDRFLSVVNTHADQYPSENLLLVTHGEGVRTTFATYKEVDVYDIE